jgi:hypothetical protein
MVTAASGFTVTIAPAVTIATCRAAAITWLLHMFLQQKCGAILWTTDCTCRILLCNARRILGNQVALVVLSPTMNIIHSQVCPVVAMVALLARKLAGFRGRCDHHRIFSSCPIIDAIEEAILGVADNGINWCWHGCDRG